MATGYDKDVQITNKPPQLLYVTDYSMWTIRFKAFMFYNDFDLWTSIIDGLHIPSTPYTTWSNIDTELNKRDKKILYERDIHDFWRTVVYVDGEVPSVEATVDGKQLITIEMMINNSLQFYDQDGVKEYSYERLLKCFRLIGYEGELKGVNSKRECFHLLGGLLLMKID
ncbi:hypothetical protein L1987_48848 [Smallanthus sonchifolius]|uniref:Uncharacterized protein n=1 Tax=Smallanthus sonchifolius TaxID=185202 RepID=A0ACB9FTP2_9ASTR|nr:hypothetical protein L1987_48848 [Smallanthus sonchifolius]